MTMARGTLSAALALCLLVNAFCLPVDVLRIQRDTNDNWNEIDGPKETSSSTIDPFDDDDDDDFGEPVTTSTGGGSSIFSLLKLATALFPSSSGSDSSVKIKKILQNLIIRYELKHHQPIRRQDSNNLINIKYATGLKLPPQPRFRKQVSDESSGSSESDGSSSDTSESDENDNSSVGNNDIDSGSTDNDKKNSESDDNDNTSTGTDSRSSNSDSSSEEDNAAEESVETDNGNESVKESSDSNNDSSDSDEDDYSDEPPGGDGQGGGILGLLAGLSGGEDGESDLGSLLGAVSGIVINLSGDGLDLNSVIASAVGLFAGLLSEGEQNPGSIVASYLLTSLDTITGGGAKNNGAFFGNFISKLLKGTIAAGESESSEEDSNENKMTMADSAGFVISLLMSILGDMSKGSSGGSSAW